MSDPQERPVPLGFYASQAMAELLREAAREQERSMSAVIRRALEAELKQPNERSMSAEIRLALREHIECEQEPSRSHELEMATSAPFSPVREGNGMSAQDLQQSPTARLPRRSFACRAKSSRSLRKSSANWPRPEAIGDRREAEAEAARQSLPIEGVLLGGDY
jgi:hypothetical protein